MQQKILTVVCHMLNWQSLYSDEDTTQPLSSK